MKKILIISFSPLHKDPRILRQIQALKDDYQLFTIGDTPAHYSNITHYNTTETLLPNKNIFIQKVIRRLKRYHYAIKNYHGFYRIKLAERFNYIFSHTIEVPDIIIANDWNGLYLASELKRVKCWKAKIYFDAHEYAPRQFDASLKWRLFMQPLIIRALQLCKNDISIMSTVCDGLAREYENFFKYPYGFVNIITNAAEYKADLKPSETQINKIRLIHHGGAMKQRRLELMIKMMKYLDPERYELTFMLVRSQPKYYNYLVKLSKKYKNIKFIEPVGFNEIVDTLNAYDIGIFLLLPENFNYKYALPNKLFEFIQARLAIAIGPSIEMVKIVEKYNLGVHSEDFNPKSLADCITQISLEKIMEYKRNSDKYAKKLSAEENIKMIKDFAAELAEK